MKDGYNNGTPPHCRGREGGKRCRTLEVNHLSAAEGGLLSSSVHYGV